ncbi:hypothetical protein M758_2G071600 [Ceratodon purpureus]|nr:hypothetical protein M758_2G071600 [Ceratodon purpureus]
MAVKMLACMSSKTLEEAIEADYEKEVKTPPRSESKSDLRKTKSFTCQTLIHPSWSFKSLGNQSASPPEASPHAERKEEVASGKPVGRGWRSFFAALQCSRAPLRSADFKGMAAKLTAGACTHSCKPCSTSASEQDAAHAVHPDTSMASVDNYNEVNFSLPVVQIQNPSSSRDDQGSNLGSARSSQAAIPEQKIDSTSKSSTPLMQSKPSTPHMQGIPSPLHMQGTPSPLHMQGTPSPLHMQGTPSPLHMQSKPSTPQMQNKPSPPQNESPSYSSYHMANGAAVKVPEELRNFNRVVPPGAGVPGTEWFSQVELGVFITFVTLSNGCNALKRIRFSRDIFSKKEAELWWAENGNRVRTVYNVPAFERTSTNDHQATSSSEEEQVSGVSGYATPAYSPQGSRGPSMRDSPYGHNSGIARGASLRDTSSREASIREASIRESIRESMRDAVSEVSDSVTNDRATETETIQSEEGSDRNFEGEETTWVEEDVPGVYLTLKNLTGGGRELKRVRFSREKFTEKQAKIWWDENRGRIHKQYL